MASHRAGKSSLATKLDSYLHVRKILLPQIVLHLLIVQRIKPIYSQSKADVRFSSPQLEECFNYSYASLNQIHKQKQYYCMRWNIFFPSRRHSMWCGEAMHAVQLEVKKSTYIWTHSYLLSLSDVMKFDNLMERPGTGLIDWYLDSDGFWLLCDDPWYQVVNGRTKSCKDAWRWTFDPRCSKWYYSSIFFFWTNEELSAVMKIFYL